MKQPVRIDFVSDVACPWCVVGLRSLLLALHALRDETDAALRLHPFELNPLMGPEGEGLEEHVARKYGSDPQRSQAVRSALREAGEGVGFAFNHTAGSRIWNTFDCHRLIAWASEQGRGVELKLALFEANFTRQEPLGDPEVLAAAAERVGLGKEDALAVLASSEFSDRVRQEEEFWRDRGVNAVPTVVFEGRWLIQGGQSPEAYARAIRQVISAQVISARDGAG
jgi:predicted DsbA family dithiol-disulfide isomerase